MNAGPHKLEESPPFVARFWGVYAQPEYTEERFISELERRFNGTWIEEPEYVTLALRDSWPAELRRGLMAARAEILDVFDEVNEYRLAYWRWVNQESGKLQADYEERLRQWEIDPHFKNGKPKPRPKPPARVKRPQRPDILGAYDGGPRA